MRVTMDSSKNEILIAIFLGILIGFISVLSFYFIFKNQYRLSSLSKKTTITLDQSSQEKNNKNIFQTFNLILDPAEDNVISETSSFTLNGQTDKKAILIVQTEDKTLRLTPDNNGNFSTKLELQPDVNQIFISAILGSQEKTIEKIIYFEKK
jgi:hypothetical protein